MRKIGRKQRLGFVGIELLVPLVLATALAIGLPKYLLPIKAAAKRFVISHPLSRPTTRPASIPATEPVSAAPGLQEGSPHDERHHRSPTIVH